MAGVALVLYASGSGVYGDLGEVEAAEDHGPMVPTSTYGASKLAGEAILAAYAAMFDFTVRAFRFGNVVGPSQTHGVGFDFVRRLLEDPTRLRILGDGKQSKSYIHVDGRHRRRAAGGLAGATRRSTRSTSRPATTSRSPRSPSWRWRCSASSRVDGLRVHRRRPRLEGRRPRRPDRDRQDPLARLGQPAHRTRGAARLDDRMADEARAGLLRRDVST